MHIRTYGSMVVKIWLATSPRSLFIVYMHVGVPFFVNLLLLS